MELFQSLPASVRAFIKEFVKYELDDLIDWLARDAKWTENIASRIRKHGPEAIEALSRDDGLKHRFKRLYSFDQRDECIEQLRDVVLHIGPDLCRLSYQQAKEKQKDEYFYTSTTLLDHISKCWFTPGCQTCPSGDEKENVIDEMQKSGKLYEMEKSGKDMTKILAADSFNAFLLSDWLDKMDDTEWLRLRTLCLELNGIP